MAARREDGCNYDPAEFRRSETGHVRNVGVTANTTVYCLWLLDCCSGGAKTRTYSILSVTDITSVIYIATVTATGNLFMVVLDETVWISETNGSNVIQNQD